MAGWSPELRQVVLIGAVFFLIFVGFSAIQIFSSKLFPGTLYSSMLTTVYAAFTLGCFVSPSVVNQCGSKRGLLLGTTGYLGLVLASILYINGLLGSWAVILGGAWCGASAAVLWTAQGSLILSLTTSETRGHLLSVFMVLMQSSALVGGLVSAAYFYHEGEESPGSGLAVLFLALMVGGVALIPCLKPQADALSSPTDWRAEAAGALRMFKDSDMLLLALLMFSTGYNKPYQYNVFTKRFSKTMTGIQSFFYFFAEMLGAPLEGWVLDRAKPTPFTTRMMLLAASVGNGLAFVYIESSPRFATVGSFGPKSVLPTLAFFGAGLTDAMVNTWLMWVLGNLFLDPTARSRAVGFYKLVQSLGYAVGFVLAPTTRVSALATSICTLLVAGLGCVLALRARSTAKPTNAPALRYSRLPNGDSSAFGDSDDDDDEEVWAVSS